MVLALAEWAERKAIALNFMEPGKPMQNGFIERFNGSFRRGVLDMHVFRNLTEVREQAKLWLADHNREIPHDSLGGLDLVPLGAWPVRLRGATISPYDALRISGTTTARKVLFRFLGQVESRQHDVLRRWLVVGRSLGRRQL